jgi:hypothetical protein
VKGPAAAANPADDLLLGVDGVVVFLLMAPSSIPSSSPPLCARTETMGAKMKGLKRVPLAEILPPHPHQAAGHLPDSPQQQDLSRHPPAVQRGSQKSLLITVPSSSVSNKQPSRSKHTCSSKHISSSSNHPTRLCNSNLLQLQLQQNLLHQ